MPLHVCFHAPRAAYTIGSFRMVFHKHEVVTRKSA
jgi:hypothetical protein